MSFENIISKINNKIANGKYAISHFQQYRANKRGTPPANNAFLNYKNFMIEELYSYHIGGGNEFQFNIGFENINTNEQIFRFGMAFSLQPCKSIPDPVSYRKSDIERFNNFFINNKKYFEGCFMWMYTPSGRTETHKVRKIKKSEIKTGNFIFIGKYINKKSKEFLESDFNIIVETFEYLFPLYKHVQLREAFSLDKRYARLTWNTNKWHSPIFHKWHKENYTNASKMHEEKHGYGHEEWLFNPRYQYKSYQYGFVQGVNVIKQEQNFIKELTLFTIDPTNKKRYIVAKVNDVEIISNSKDIQEEIYPLFQKWKKTMINELKDIGADYEFFVKEGFIPNIRFKNENALVYEDKFEAEVLKNHKFTRFNAYKVENHLELVELETSNSIKDLFIPGEGRTPKGYKRVTKASSKDVISLHSEITDFLRDYLVQEWKLNLERSLSVEKTRLDGV